LIPYFSQYHVNFSIKYYNNSQEIDMEALSSQLFQNGTNLINLVQQTQTSAARGYSLIGQDYLVAALPFDPTNGFHEYRFDFVPGYINFYADQVLIGSMSSPPPAAGRHLILSHWSNGNSQWSQGPPAQDAVLTIGYVKAYFNSSDLLRQSAALARCLDPSAPGACCPIIDDVLQGGTLFSEFFSNQPNKTNNQTVYGKNGGATIRAPLSLSVWFQLSILIIIVLLL
jgi:beta-glucanase (GH16 family)